MSRILTPGVNYNAIVKAFKDRSKKGVGLEGASRSGKSYDVAIFLIQYIDTFTNKRIVIARDTFANLKETTYKTLKEVWIKSGKPANHFNKVASSIHYNGNEITFIGINDNIMRAHGMESDILWINEALSISKESADQLEQRNKRFYIYDYNPSATIHWLFDKEHLPGYSLKKTTIFDNPYAPPNAKEKILSYACKEYPAYEIAKKARYLKAEWSKLIERNEETGTADPYMWQVYGLGVRAVGEEIIFREWEVIDTLPSNYDWRLYGGDFGYSQDPTAIIEVIRSGNNIYLHERLYETGLLNQDIANFMNDSFMYDEVSVWDSSEPKSIDELRLQNIPAEGADKGPGSVAWSIQKMQGLKLHITSTSVNLLKELKNYRWARDRQGQFKRNTLGQRVPIDKDDHAVQAAMYAIMRYQS